MLGLKRLLHLALVGEESQVGTESMRSFGESGQRRDDLSIDLARIRLPGNGIAGIELKRGGDAAVEFVDLGVVAVEKREEAGLRAGRSFHAEKF